MSEIMSFRKEYRKIFFLIAAIEAILLFSILVLSACQPATVYVDRPSHADDGISDNPDFVQIFENPTVYKINDKSARVWCYVYSAGYRGGISCLKY